jgi:hypothetical protein
VPFIKLPATNHQLRWVAIALGVAFAFLAPQNASAAAVPQQCSAIPPNRDAVASEFDKSWMVKRDAIADEIASLRKYRKDLDDDNSLWIGPPGSKRELLTIFAMITKTTTDLIQDLAPLGGKIESLTYKLITSANDIITTVDNYRQNKPDWYVDAGLKLGDELDPTNIGLIAFRDFTKNTVNLANLQGDLDESRKVYREQMERLDRQLDKAQKSIDDLENKNRDKAVDRLFARYQAVQRSCQTLADKCELESFDSCPDHPVIDGLKCQDAKLHKWYVCLDEQKAKEQAAGPDLKMR